MARGWGERGGSGRGGMKERGEGDAVGKRERAWHGRGNERGTPSGVRYGWVEWEEWERGMRHGAGGERRPWEGGSEGQCDMGEWGGGVERMRQVWGGRRVVGGSTVWGRGGESATKTVNRCGGGA